MTKTAYVSHPCSKAQKEKLKAQGFMIIDIRFRPAELGEDDIEVKAVKPKPAEPVGTEPVITTDNTQTGGGDGDDNSGSGDGTGQGGKIELGTDSGDGFTDDQLRGLIEEYSGTKPHHLTGRAKLIELYNGLNIPE